MPSYKYLIIHEYNVTLINHKFSHFYYDIYEVTTKALDLLE